MQKLIYTTDAADLDLDEMSIEEAIKHLQSLQEKYSKDWTDLQIYEDSCYEGGYTLRLRGKHTETDLQYENRMRRHKESLERQMTQDHLEYKRLKALFEKEQ